MCLIWVQEPSEESFDINSVPKEVKTKPLAEKKAPGKKPTGLGAPSGPPTTVDAYEKLLSSIPEFANFGKLFKVLPLTLPCVFLADSDLDINPLLNILMPCF